MAKYDHGGGCACGLSRFCDCSQSTAQDRKDREAYDRMYGKKEKPVTTYPDQREDLHRLKVRGVRKFDDRVACIEFLSMTKGVSSMDMATGNHIVEFYVANDMHRDYLVNVWQPGMPYEPGPATAKVEFDKEEIIFLSTMVDGLIESLKKTMPDVAMPPVAGAVQKKLAMFRKEMDK
jgi:hypothetical protein